MRYRRIARNPWMMKANSPLKYEWNILAKTKTCSPSKRKWKNQNKKLEQSQSHIVCKYKPLSKSVHTIVSDFSWSPEIKQKPVFHFSSFFRLMTIKGNFFFKGARRAVKECQWYCMPPAVCEVPKDPGDEWVCIKKINLIIMFSNPD